MDGGLYHKIIAKARLSPYQRTASIVVRSNLNHGLPGGHGNGAWNKPKWKPYCHCNNKCSILPCKPENRGCKGQNRPPGINSSPSLHTGNLLADQQGRIGGTGKISAIAELSGKVNIDRIILIRLDTPSPMGQHDTASPYRFP